MRRRSDQPFQRRAAIAVSTSEVKAESCCRRHEPNSSWTKLGAASAALRYPGLTALRSAWGVGFRYSRCCQSRFEWMGIFLKKYIHVVLLRICFADCERVSSSGLSHQHV